MKEFYTNYKFILVGVVVWAGIQLFKTIYDSIAHKKLMLGRFWGTGGMPSSHSAVVTCLTTMIGKYEGLSSPIFALSCCFAFIVMFDACNLRKSVGKQAKFLNDLLQEKNTSNFKNLQDIQWYKLLLD